MEEQMIREYNGQAVFYAELAKALRALTAEDFPSIKALKHDGFVKAHAQATYILLDRAEK